MDNVRCTTASDPQRECYCEMSPLGVGMSARVSVCVRPPQRRLFARNLSGVSADKRFKKPRAAFSVQFVNFNCVLTAADDTACRHLQLEPVYQLQQQQKSTKARPKNREIFATQHEQSCLLEVGLDKEVSKVFLRRSISS